MNVNNIVFCLLLCLIIYYLIIMWGLYLVDNNYLQENFQQNVDLPLNTRYSCSNFCGPNSQCAFTKEQCSTDYDCQGCKPKLKKDFKYKSKDVPGDEDAGKLTFSQTPQYSSLTTDFGSQSSYISSKQVPQMYLGKDMWEHSFNQGMKYFSENQSDNDRELHKDFEFEPNYPKVESITGLFETNEVPASNTSL